MRARSLAAAGAMLAAVAFAQAILAQPTRDEAGLLPASCDRACLTGLVDQYLAALIAHDPKRLPLARNVKFTENGQVMEVGDGMWATATTLGRYKHYVADPQGGAVGFLGTVDESSQLAILGLRMKIENRQVTEIETLVFRNRFGPGSGKLLDGQKLKPIWDQTLRPEERSPRRKMIEIANSYFEKIEDGNGAHPAPFDAGCNRTENGLQTTNNPAAGSGGNSLSHLGCEEQLSTGMFVFDTELRDRRFLVIDEEKGVVYSHVFFDHAGNVKTWKNLKTGEVKPVGNGVLRPSAWEIHELFKIKNGRIHEIEAVLVDVPYKMRSNWERQ
jgi:hypothetical protein